MKKRNIVKSKLLFNDIIKNGSRKSNKYYVVCFKKKEAANTNFGFAVGTKMGKAVIRNKIKRQLKCIVDKNMVLFPNYNDYIIISKKDLLELDFQQMDMELQKLIKEIQ